MNEPPKDRFCDLVMKGGITSGVVYPRAVALLAKHYRFNSIGGTSAGAIVAAVTAAAEYHRRHSGGSRAGFEQLRDIPDELARDADNGAGRRQSPAPRWANPLANPSKLLSLFQPAFGTHRLFRVLVCSLNATNTGTRWISVLFGFLIAYWPAVIFSLLTGCTVGYSLGHGLGAALLTLMLALASIAAWVYSDLTYEVATNGYGICSGMTESTKYQGLTPWLHEHIQRAAGLSTSTPLTFGDLWGAPDPPNDLQLSSFPKGVRSIDLRMYATNLSHGRPYVFPLEEQLLSSQTYEARDSLYFVASELQRYLPTSVIRWLIQHSTQVPADRAFVTEQGSNRLKPMPNLRSLPEPDKFPVLLAARMSLSFPMLLSAVPLYAAQYQVEIDNPTAGSHKNAAPAFERCWFSDGGISSNFPMHLFDGLVPRWPTFGISLEKKAHDNQDTVFLPQDYAVGYDERWSRFATKSQLIARLGGFFGAITSTMQNWNDTTLARMPGVRDRVVRVRLAKDEGGMNLNMPASTIQKIATLGETAAQLLIDRFLSSSTESSVKPGWDEHRFVRLGTLLKMLEDRAPEVAIALEPDVPHANSFQNILQRYLDKAHGGDGQLPPGFDTPLTESQKQDLDQLISALRQYCNAFVNRQQKSNFKSIPKPELRVRPSL